MWLTAGEIIRNYTGWKSIDYQALNYFFDYLSNIKRIALYFVIINAHYCGLQIQKHDCKAFIKQCDSNRFQWWFMKLEQYLV